MFEWITGLVSRFGYVGVGLLTFLENIVPPIPSELVMPLAGFVARQGELGLLAIYGRARASVDNGSGLVLTIARDDAHLAIAATRT